MRNDQLPGALLIGALFFLFAFVFTVPLWVEPFLRAAQVGEGKDWIGFAGNVIGTLVAVLAAGTAWFIAQKQIATSRQQNAVVAYHAFSSVLDTIDVQIRICNSTHEALVAFNESLRDALLNINKSRTYGPGWTSPLIGLHQAFLGKANELVACFKKHSGATHTRPLVSEASRQVTILEFRMSEIAKSVMLTNNAMAGAAPSPGGYRLLIDQMNAFDTKSASLILAQVNLTLVAERHRVAARQQRAYDIFSDIE